jgi:hypothetical protein
MTGAHWAERGGLSWPLLAWTILVVGISVWTAASYIQHASVDVVCSDTWDYMQMIDGFLSGVFDPSEILKAHNQNRTAILVGILLTSARFDNFNQKHIEYLNLFFVSITLVNVLYLSYLLFKGRPLARGVITLVSSIALFSLVQWENLLLSINLIFFSTVAFSVTSIVLMALCLRGQYTQMTAAILFAVAVIMSELALFSMGGGVVVWAVNLVQIGLAIILFQFQVRALTALLAYLAIAIVSVSAYLWGLEAGGSLWFLLSHPLESLAYFMIGTGNSIVGWFSNGPALWLDFLVGLFLNLVFLFVFAHFRRLPLEEQRRSLVLISLILFGVLEQVLVTYGRLPLLGLSSAATSRYSTLTVVAPVAALIFLILHADVSLACLRLAVVTGLVMLMFTVIGDRRQMISAGAMHFYYSSLQQFLLDDKKIGPWEQMLLGRKPLDIIQKGNEVLRKYRLSFYRRLPVPS